MRTRALIIVAAGAVLGGALIASQAWFRAVLREWLLADPQATAARARILLAGMGVLLVVPLVGFAIYMWRQEADAAHRRLFRALASFLVVAALGLAVVLWRFGALVIR